MTDGKRDEIKPDVVEVSASFRLPDGLASLAKKHDDVEGHEFDEEDPQERMFHMNMACCG